MAFFELPQLTAKRDLQVCEASLDMESSKLLGLRNRPDPFLQTLETGKFVFWFMTLEVWVMICRKEVQNYLDFVQE